MKLKKLLTPLVLIASTGALFGCGDSDDDSNDTAAPANTDPLYALCLGVMGQAPVTLLGTLPNLDKGTEFDTESAIELPETGFVVCKSYKESMYTGAVGGNVISRYDLNDDLQFEKTDEISLENTGITVGFQSTFFVSDTVAYTFDPANHKAVRWDPQTMTITGEVLEYTPGQVSSGTLQWATSASMQQAGDFIFDIRRVWDNEIGDYVPGLEIVVFDTRDESFVYEYTDLCGGFAGYAETANGDVYFTSNNVSAAAHRMQLGTPLKPCIVRMKAGETMIDPDYNVDYHLILKDQLDNGAHPLSGETTAALIPSVGNGGIVMGFDEDLVPVQDDAYCTANTASQEDYDACLWDSGTMQRQPAWIFYHIEDLGAETLNVQKIEGMAPSGGANFNFVVDGRAYVLSFLPDFSGATFFDVTDPANVFEGITIRGGFATGVTRIQ